MRLVSLGDYVLNGGEVAAMAVVEAVSRLVPGVVGNPESLVEESHEDGLLGVPELHEARDLARPRGAAGPARAATTGRSPRGGASRASSARELNRPDLLT